MNRSRLIAIACFFPLVVSLGAQALTCQGRIHFVVKCNAGVCSEGFFAFRVFSGNWCNSFLDVKGDEKIWPFAGGLVKPLKDANGIYMIDAPGDYFGSQNLKFQKCFGLNEQDAMTLRCDLDTAKITRLSYSESTSLKDVIGDFKAKSQSEKIFEQIMNWILPLAILANSVVVWRRNRKPQIGKTILLLAIFATLGVGQMHWGRKTWALSGLFGFVVLFAWFVENVITRLRHRRRANEVGSGSR